MGVRAARTDVEEWLRALAAPLAPPSPARRRDAGPPAGTPGAKAATVPPRHELRGPVAATGAGRSDAPLGDRPVPDAAAAVVPGRRPGVWRAAAGDEPGAAGATAGAPHTPARRTATSPPAEDVVRYAGPRAGAADGGPGATDAGWAVPPTTHRSPPDDVPATHPDTGPTAPGPGHHDAARSSAPHPGYPGAADGDPCATTTLSGPAARGVATLDDPWPHAAPAADLGPRPLVTAGTLDAALAPLLPPPATRSDAGPATAGRDGALPRTLPPPATGVPDLTEIDDLADLLAGLLEDEARALGVLELEP